MPPGRWWSPAVCLTLGWMTDDVLPEGVSPLWPVLAGVALFALLGLGGTGCAAAGVAGRWTCSGSWRRCIHWRC